MTALSMFQNQHLVFFSKAVPVCTYQISYIKTEILSRAASVSDIAISFPFSDQQYSWSPSQYFDEDSYSPPPKNMKGLSGGRPQLQISSAHTCGISDCEHAFDHLQHGPVDPRQSYLLSPTESCPLDHHRCSPRSSIHSECMVMPVSMASDHVSSSTFPRMHTLSHKHTHTHTHTGP